MFSTRITVENVIPPVTVFNNVTMGNCTRSLFQIVLHALPCDSVEFSSFAISIANGPKYSTNLSFPRTLAAGEVDTLLINFPPQNLNGTYIITAHVTGKYLGSIETFDTTVQIRVTFTSSAGALVASVNPMDLNTVTSCASADTLITFTNLGCDSIIVTGDETTWLPNWSAADPAFPFPLAPDSSFTVHVHYVPTSLGWSQQTVNYTFTDIGGNAEKSLPLALTATAVSAPSKLALSDTALAFGTFARCNASADTMVRLTNTGCDSLLVSSASVGAGTGFTLAGGGDTMLAPNQSAVFRIGFADSLAGNYAGALHVQAVGAHGGAAFDTTIPLSATVIEGSKLATLSTQSIDFGTTSICEERDSSVTIRNIGCEVDTITGIFSNPSFASLASLPLLIIQPDSQLTIPLLTNADTTSHATTNTDTLRFSGNLDAMLAPVVLSRGLMYPGSFALGLTAQRSAPISTVVPVYILRRGTVPAAASELDFALTYDDDLLAYTNALQPDITATDSRTLPSGLTVRSFAMKPAQDHDTIATLYFESYLAKNERTPITLSDQQFVVGGAISPPCVASIDTTPSDTGFTLELVCGDSEIMKVMQGVPLQIISMQVNPESLNVTLARGDARYSACTAQVLNVLGTEESEQSIALHSVTHASLGTGTLPAGTYFLRLTSDGYVITRRFVIVK